MPTAKERKLDAERLRQLAQLGYTMPCEHQVLQAQPAEAIIEQCAPPIECPLIDLQRGTLYLVWLSLAGKRPGVCLYDFRFVPPWPDQNFQTLPTTEACRGEAYVLPNKWEFSRRDVLNLRFRASGWRLQCRPVEGLLCGLSATPIPREYRHGKEIRVRVEFFGKSGGRLAETVSTLCVDRSIAHSKISQRAAELAKAEFAAKRAQRWRNFLRNLTPEEAQKLGVDSELAAIMSEHTTRARDGLFVDPRTEHKAAVARASSSLQETAKRRLARRSTRFDGEAPPDWAVEALTAYSPDKTACSLKEGAERFGRPEHSCREGGL